MFMVPATDLMVLVILSYIYALTNIDLYLIMTHSIGAHIVIMLKIVHFFSIFSGDGTCKHVAAFLFGLQRFCASLVDTSEVSVTDEKAKWVNPNRNTVSAKVSTLDLRCDPSGDAPLVKPSPDTYKLIPLYAVS